MKPSNILKGILAIMVLLMVWSCSKNPASIVEKETSQAFDQMTIKSESIVPGQYIVVLKEPGLVKTNPSIKYDEALAYARTKALAVMSQSNISSEKLGAVFGTAILGFVANLSDPELAVLKKDKRVSYIENDRIIILAKEDEEPVEQPVQTIPWGIARVGYASGIGKTAWIIDTGVDFDHPDLNVDTIRQMTFVPGTKTADDDQGHGTRCAGTVAAIDNEIGVVGVASGATVVPVKVSSVGGRGLISWHIAGVDYVASAASPGDAVNISWRASIDQSIDDAVLAASSKGIFFAIGSCNDSDYAYNYSPQRVNGPYVWTVSAMDSTDTWAYFSNFGNPPVDFCQPGIGILTCTIGGTYAISSGTSRSAPHMCGILLITNGNPTTNGYVKNDPDGIPDPIGHI